MAERFRAARRSLAPLLTVGVVLAAGACAGDDAPAERTTTTTATSTTGRAGAASTPTTASGQASSGNGRFTIVGRRIVDPDGKVFVPIGANVAVRQGGFEEGYAFNWNGTATDRSDDVLAWGWNTVRATLVCLPPNPSPNVDDLNAGIDAFIDEYTAKKIVVIVECHDVTVDDLPVDDPKVQSILEFWDRLANKHRDNTYVWFNPFNEPYGGADRAAVEGWMELQQTALTRLRALAPHNVFVADIPGGGQGVETFLGERSIARLGRGQCNVLYSWHTYGALGKDGAFGSFADYDDEAASRANHNEAFAYLRDNDIPMLIGEVGDPLTLDEGSAGQPIWNRIAARIVIEDAPKYGIGMLWWHATGDSGVFLTYSLMANREEAPWSAAATGEGLSDSGRRFWEASKNRPAPEPFTGDLAASNCE